MGIHKEEIVQTYSKIMAKKAKSFNKDQLDLDFKFSVSNTTIDKEYANAQRSFEIQCNLDDHYLPVVKLNTVVIEKPLLLEKTTKGYRVKVELVDGSNKIEIGFKNTLGISSIFKTFSFKVNKTGKKVLYVAAVGVNQYQQKNYNLNFAAKDALDLSTKLKTSTSYDSVAIIYLKNKEVTKENLEKLGAFFGKMSRDDVGILYVAGHGLLDASYDYFYATHDIDFNNPNKRGVSYKFLEDLLKKGNSIKTLLIMDTCHSGEVDKDELKVESKASLKKGKVVFRGMDQAGLTENKYLNNKYSNQIIQELFLNLERESGNSVLSSCTGSEVAFESEEWNNGLFTYSLLSALDNQYTDYNKDGKIMLSELQWQTTYMVKKLSKNKQNPSVRGAEFELDFPIY